MELKTWQFWKKKWWKVQKTWEWGKGTPFSRTATVNLQAEPRLNVLDPSLEWFSQRPHLNPWQESRVSVPRRALSHLIKLQLFCKNRKPSNFCLWICRTCRETLEKTWCCDCREVFCSKLSLREAECTRHVFLGFSSKIQNVKLYILYFLTVMCYSVLIFL